MAWTQWVITVLMDLSVVNCRFLNQFFGTMYLIEKNACRRIGLDGPVLVLGRPGRSGQVVVDMRLSIGVDTFSFSAHRAVGGTNKLLLPPFLHRHYSGLGSSINKVEPKNQEMISGRLADKA